MTANPYRDLPSVDALAANLPSRLPRPLVVAAAREAIEQARSRLTAGGEADVQQIAEDILRAAERASGTSVINATGVLLHTNLGRALWSSSAIERATDAAGRYTNLELDLDTGDRGRRGAYVETLLREATGAEAAVVVNNNASALLLTLAVTASGRSVPVSRGELIEIGGSYRLPAVMEASGAHLVEVGTTNRTRVDDYLIALQTYDCGAILKVHPSNYKMDGFTESAGLSELSGLKSDGIPLLYDLGSGLLDAAAAWLPDWISSEPGARQALESGSDLVMFSGDKLLGGPQSGIILGSASLISRIRSHPLTRALRVDATIYAALGATLESYVAGTPTDIPFWRHALASESHLLARCQALADEVGGEVEEGTAEVGAGSAPGIGIPGPTVRITRAQKLYEGLLEHEPPVLCRRDAGDLLIDLRAVDPDDDRLVAAAILRCQ